MVTLGICLTFSNIGVDMAGIVCSKAPTMTSEAVGGSTALARKTPENANILHWLKGF